MAKGYIISTGWRWWHKGCKAPRATDTGGRIRVDQTMDLNSLGVFKLMSKKMNWLTQRQEVLAQNVANVYTPKFKPQDITPFTFRTALSEGRQLEPTMTNPSHMALPRANDGPGKVGRERKPYETKPDGNAVVVEEQMLKMSQAAQDFNMVTNLYKKNVSLLKSALSRGS